ncbi:N-acetylglutaminylglutamine amidotransferase [Hahella ganghwensis]|uniref:N-acetylglutaminylglutamine amidotransferase n=1 Tax=Hahella ganghwensis TaxID=286420 RepID=UPI0003616E3B|nr:N-acetylglutaminylglutamine amidotransferase [Hahella ganghwensis]
MCGICGEIRFDNQPPDLQFIQQANYLQQPRGPDAEGVWVQNNVAFGHRRLKIMDLSEASQQPLYDPSLGLSVVFNGAIYNHPELREELKQMGYRFYSEGDTEVVLKAYHAWGRDCVKHFNGMFAIAVWERESGKTLLFRDRLGIKPLYYHRDTHRMKFASFLPALAKGLEHTPGISPSALNKYLNFHSVVPSPETLFDGIHKVPPGTVIEVHADGSVQQESYWDLTFETLPDEEKLTAQEWQDRLLQELFAAVRRRNVAAVDVGVLLSGGVDSSLLVGLLAEVNPNGFQTFSIGFEAVGGEAGDEFQYSDIIAEHFGTRHHKIRIAEDRMLEALPHAIRAMSEPMVSHDCVAFYLLSQEVSKHCRVVQSGQGADEVFGGYHWYPPLAGSQDPFASYRQAFFDRSHDEYLETVQPAWASHDSAGEFVRQHFLSPGAKDPIDKALRLDTRVMLVDDPVKRVDNMTMASSLEARVPFLDHQLVELAARIPAPMKVRDEGKWILKEASRKVIPAAVIDRPKGYFPVPALKYLRGNVLNWVKEALTTQAARDRGLFNQEYVDRLLLSPDMHITPLRGSKLWQLGLLELWLQQHDF